MYICDFSRSDGAGSATTRNTRGLTRSVIALIAPPLPAASRPSKTTITRRPFSFTHSCSVHSSTCSLRSSVSYSLRFIGSSAVRIGHLHVSVGCCMHGIAAVNREGAEWRRASRPRARSAPISCTGRMPSPARRLDGGPLAYEHTAPGGGLSSCVEESMGMATERTAPLYVDPEDV